MERSIDNTFYSSIFFSFSRFQTVKSSIPERTLLHMVNYIPDKYQHLPGCTKVGWWCHCHASWIPPLSIYWRLIMLSFAFMPFVFMKGHLAANLNGFMCLHLWSISLRLFNDLLLAIAMMVFSDKHKSQNLIPFWYGRAFIKIFDWTLGLRHFFFNFQI